MGVAFSARLNASVAPDAPARIDIELPLAHLKSVAGLTETRYDGRHNLMAHSANCIEKAVNVLYQDMLSLRLNPTLFLPFAHDANRGLDSCPCQFRYILAG